MACGNGSDLVGWELVALRALLVSGEYRSEASLFGTIGVYRCSGGCHMDGSQGQAVHAELQIRSPGSIGDHTTFIHMGSRDVLLAADPLSGLIRELVQMQRNAIDAVLVIF